MKKPGAFKIVKSETISSIKGEDRFVIMSSTDKLINDCFGNGYTSRQSAYYGFRMFSKRYYNWKKEQRNKNIKTKENV